MSRGRFWTVDAVRSYLTLDRLRAVKTARLLFVPSREQRLQLLDGFYVNSALEIAGLSRVLQDREELLFANARRLWEALEQQIREANRQDKTLCLLGLDAYLNLHSLQIRGAFWNLLRSALDEEGIGFLALFHCHLPRELAALKPSYRENAKLICLGAEPSSSDVVCPNLEDSSRIGEKGIPSAYAEAVPLLPAALVPRELVRDWPAGARGRDWRLLQMHEYLLSYEQEEKSEIGGAAGQNGLDVVLPVDYRFYKERRQKKAGMRENLAQIVDDDEFMQRFYGLEGLPSEGLKWIRGRIAELEGQRPNPLWKEDGSSRLIGRDLVGWCLECPQGGEKEQIEHLLKCLGRYLLNRQEGEAAGSVCLWYLRGCAHSDSYLDLVLSDGRCAAGSFAELYVLKALDLAGDSRAELLAEERRRGLKILECVLHLDDELREFIEQGRQLPLPEMLPWLNNGLDMEAEELLRRLRGERWPDRAALNRAFPLMGAYLAPYDLGYDILNEYFEAYRRQKVGERCEEAFALSLAAEARTLPYEINYRDELLGRYCADADTALLVVDALGAEYIPLLLHRAGFYGLRAEQQTVALAKLPSSTRFNKIEKWPKELQGRTRRFDSKAVDNIVHYGTEAHEPSEPEVCLWKTLLAIEEQIKAVRRYLRSFQRVILTADHGASRLALLAKDNGKGSCAKKLELPDRIKNDVSLAKDWRYLQLPAGYGTAALSGSGGALWAQGELPAECCRSEDGQYVCVRSYARFAVSGNKKYSLHGGASWEERLVPFIVFERGAAFISPAVPTAAEQSEYPAAEFEEDEDFDF